MLTGKVAIVTGGASGHGQRIAQTMVQQGAKVVIADVNDKKGHDTVDDIRERGGEALYIHTDISDEDEVQHLVKSVKDTYGQIDILVNNAGITQNKPIEDIEYDEWKKMLNINLAGAFLCTKYVLGHMRSRQYGRVVNISSIAAIMGGGYIGTSHYAASKAGLIGFTKAIAKETAADGITVNAIAPGLCKTPMSEHLFHDQEEERLISTIPKGRVGTPDDISNTVIFLSSDKSDYITGQTICVDGGVSIGTSKIIG